MNQEASPSDSEEEQVIGELWDTLTAFIENEQLEVDPADVNFLFTDGESGEPRDFNDVLAATFGFLLEQGYDPDEVLAN